MKNKILAIIPARGGSKRLPKKNILPLDDKPLISYTIEAAKNSQYIDTVVVSSDDESILNIAKKNNIKTISRPKDLASDTSTTVDAILHTLETFNDFDTVILLQPTSPLRTNIHIDEAINEFISKDADSIISVCENEHSPLWSNRLNCNQSMANFIPKDILNLRSQDLPTYYRLNGAIYIINKKIFVKEKKFLLDENIYAYIMDQESSVDIDTKLDFLIAESILKLNKGDDE